MAANQQDTWSLDEDDVVTASLEDAQAHDAYWAKAHSRENYFRAGLDYEDYASAYCAGYIGQAQYGGDFDEAEKSLISNWVRIKGDSRLSLDEARMAMRAAWDRAAQVTQTEHVDVHVQPWVRVVGRALENANAWLDRIGERVLGGRPAPQPMARRAQQGGLVRH
jgi:hypothetical protein